MTLKMKNIFLKSLSALSIGVMGLTAVSCADDLNLSPIDNFGAGNFWKSQELFEGHISAQSARFRNLYTGVAASDFNNPSMYYLLAGELRGGINRNDLIDNSTYKKTEFVDNTIAESSPGFSNFANIYQLIGDYNEFLHYADANASVFKDEAARHYMKGMVHGLRAFSYFQLFKLWGPVPLRTTPDVPLGNINPLDLYIPRAKASEVVAAIKNDLKLSLEEFEAGKAYTKFSSNKYFWGVNATRMLAGEVYLWAAKVSYLDKDGNVSGIYDWKASGATDIAAAKTYFEQVLAGGYTLQDSYANVFSSKRNSELIYTVGYEKGIAVTTTWVNYLYASATGLVQAGGYLMPVEADGLTPSTTAQWSGWYYNAATGKPERNGVYVHNSGNNNRAMYKNEVFYQYDKNDTRRDMFIPVYIPNASELAEKTTEYKSFENFDETTHYLAGVFFAKFKPTVEATTDKYENLCDQPVYRLAHAYAYLAEIANYQGVNGDVEKYINEIRKRAYGAAWDEDTYGYKAGSFRENEAAILIEKTKEFIGEGQRWWDLRRLTGVKDGKASDHFLFQPESASGWGLANDPYYVASAVANSNGDVTTTTINTNTPLLTYDTQWNLQIFPLNAGLLTSDQLEQTIGYGVAGSVK